MFFFFFCAQDVVDCVVGDWSDWSACNVTCGHGFQHRNRDVTRSPTTRGHRCPPLLEYRPCQMESCQQDCVLGQWSPWTSCSVVCGVGVQKRTRGVMQWPEGGGKACGDTEEERQCEGEEGQCDRDCQESDWSEWGACSAKECGETGTRTRTRTIVKAKRGNGKSCGDLAETKACLKKCKKGKKKASKKRKASKKVSRKRGNPYRKDDDDGDDDDNYKKIKKSKKSKKNKKSKKTKKSKKSKKSKNGKRKYSKKSKKNVGGTDACAHVPYGPWAHCADACGALSRRDRIGGESDDGCPSFQHELCPVAQEGHYDGALCCPYASQRKCIGKCQWCKNTEPAIVMEEAETVLAVHAEGGFLVGRDGLSRVWHGKDVRVLGLVKGGEDCEQVTSVDMMVSRSQDADDICSNNLSPHHVYLLSGKCRGPVFFVDPCGVRIRLEGPLTKWERNLVRQRPALDEI